MYIPAIAVIGSTVATIAAAALVGCGADDATPAAKAEVSAPKHSKATGVSSEISQDRTVIILTPDSPSRTQAAWAVTAEDVARAAKSLDCPLMQAANARTITPLTVRGSTVRVMIACADSDDN